MPDAIFDHPRAARVYDPLDPDRSDLDTYVNLVDEFGATAVLDVGGEERIGMRLQGTLADDGALAVMDKEVAHALNDGSGS